MLSDWPGREVPKDYREVITYLIDSHGRTYQRLRGGGYPQLRPADPVHPPNKVPLDANLAAHLQ